MERPDAGQLMESAWEIRRRALDVSPGEQQSALSHARDRLRQAIDLLESDADLVPRAHALHLLANVEVDSGDAGNAEQLWRESVRLLRGSNEPLQLAHTLRHLGDLLRGVGNLEQATPILEEALALYRRHTPADGAQPAQTLDLANAVQRMALLREASQQRSEAIALWTEARGLYSALGLNEGTSEADQHLAALEGVPGHHE